MTYLLIGFLIGTATSLTLTILVLILPTKLQARSLEIKIPLGQILGITLRRSPKKLLFEAQKVLQEENYPSGLEELEITYITQKHKIKSPQDLIQEFKNKSLT
jgi:cadmium resistance protein CadD (predicted permease)